MGMRKLLVTAAAMCAAAVMATSVGSARADTTVVTTLPDGTMQSVTTSAPYRDTATAGAAYCADATFARWGNDLTTGTVEWKLWSHNHWCYYQGGNVYLRTGYQDTYTAEGWETSSSSWAKFWYNPYSSWQSVAKAKFNLVILGQVVQSKSATICVVMGNGGGARWC